MKRCTLLLVGSVALSACTTAGTKLPEPRSRAETFAGFSYVPLDPLPVTPVAGLGCSNGQISGPTLNALPDNAVRIAVRQVAGKGSLGVGTAQVGAEGNSYEVVLDYINADASNIRFFYSSDSALSEGSAGSLPQIQKVRRLDMNEKVNALESDEGEFVVPVYVGIGLRLTANVTVLKGSVNLGSLGALAAAAQAERITGSMIVQTLGITGPQVTSSLPLPSELNPTTIQNAILALGSIKAIVYDEGTLVTPRVTGIYNSLGTSDQRTINMIVSELASRPVEWGRACTPENG